MKKLWLTCVFCLCSSVAAAATPQNLNTLLSHFTSLQADFTITSESAHDIAGQVSQGTLSIMKPNQFNYHVAAPNEELFISNGQKLWDVEPDLKQITISPLTQNLSTTPLLLLSGSTKDINDVFTVKKVDDTDYVLTPKAEDSMIGSIALGFDHKGVIKTLSITNTLGDTSTLTFSDVKLNQKLGPSLFRYTPAPDMDVLQ